MMHVCARLLLQVFGFVLATGERSLCRVPSALATSDGVDQTSLLQEQPRFIGRGELHEHSLLQGSLVSEAGAALAKIAQSLAKRKAESLVVILGKSVADSLAKRKEISLKRMNFLDEMFDTAAGIVQESVTPTVTRFVDNIMENIDDTILPAIIDEHDVEQELLRTLWAPIDDAEAASAPGQRLAYETAGTQHAGCRGNESELCAITAECQGRLETAARTLTAAGEAVTQLQSVIWGDGCAADLDKSQLSFRSAVRPTLHQYLAAEEHADAAREAHDAIAQECEDKQKEQLSQRETCNGEQQLLEESGCAYASAVSRARRNLLDDFDRLVESYQIAAENIRKTEVDRKQEYKTLQRTKCLLDRTYDAVGEPCDAPPAPVTETAAQIVACQSLEVDTTFLDITYNATGDAPEAPAMPIYPCTPEYLNVQYGSLAPVDTCAGPRDCSACVGLLDSAEDASPVEEAAPAEGAASPTT